MIAGRTEAPESTRSFVEMFEEAEDATYDARLRAERDRDYYNGIQLTSEETQALKKRGQPPVVTNRIRPKVDYLLGLEIQTRTDPKAIPRTPQHEQGAEAASDALRFVADKEDWDGQRTLVYEDMLIEGFGGAEVVHKQVGDKLEVDVNYYPWDRLFYDPHSRKHDFSDARYLGAVIWSDAEELGEQYPKEKDNIAWTLDDSSTSDTYDDRPKYYLWGDKTRRRVRVVLLHYIKDGQWYSCKFHKGGKLEEGPSPYMDENGKSVCPLLLQSMYVDRDNNRYGIVRDMISPQDEINKRRSKALHLLTMRQTIAEKGAVDSVADARRELARPDGFIEVQPDMRFEISQTGDLASGQVALLNEAKSEIDMMGANSALAGETGESASGRAVLARQQGGMVEIAPQIDKLHQFTKRVYEHMWMRIRQLWTEERWINVTDDDRNVRFVGFNRPVRLRDQLQQLPEEEVLEFARQYGLRPGDPRLDQAIDVQNPIEQMDVDISIEEVPDQVSMQAEQFQAVMGLAPAIVQAKPQLGDVILEMMMRLAPGLKADDRKKLTEGLEAVRQQEQQGGAQSQEMQQIAAQMQMQEGQLALAKGEADIEATMAKAIKDRASAASMLMPEAATGL